MKIAVTYDSKEKVFQHFGHTEQFKVYDIENNEIVKLICGGIGGCAVNALTEAGIEIFAGISGKADDAVNSLLKGTLEQTTSPNCSHHGDGNHHHHENGHSCSHSCH